MIYVKFYFKILLNNISKVRLYKIIFDWEELKF